MHVLRIWVFGTVSTYLVSWFSGSSRMKNRRRKRRVAAADAAFCGECVSSGRVEGMEWKGMVCVRMHLVSNKMEMEMEMEVEVEVEVEVLRNEWFWVE